jgi:hypothetical protein
MKLALLSALLLPATVWAQATNPPTLKAPRQTKYDRQVYDVTRNEIKMSLTYLDLTECMAKVEKDASLNRWNETQKAEEKAKIPAGGYLQGSWSRDLPTLASADNFTFLVESPDGRELQRWKPAPSIARPFSILGATVFTDLTLVPLSEPLPDGARVYVIEAAAQRRFEYVIHP